MDGALRIACYALLGGILFMWGGAQTLMLGGLCVLFGIAIRKG